MDRNLVEALKFIGFSEYEAKVYIALVQLGGGTAAEISKTSLVPTNRVYQTLDRLQDKGFVKGQIGDSIANYYVPEIPDKVIDNIETEYVDKIRLARRGLSAIWERAKRKDFPVMWTLRGNRSVFQTIHEILEMSSEYFYLAIDTLFDIQEYSLLPVIKEKKLEGVDIRILTSLTGIDDPGEKEILKEMEHVPVRVMEKLDTIWCVSEKPDTLLGGFGMINERGEKDFVCLQSSDKGFHDSVKLLFISAWENSTESVK